MAEGVRGGLISPLNFSVVGSSPPPLFFLRFRKYMSRSYSCAHSSDHLKLFHGVMTKLFLVRFYYGSLFIHTMKFFTCKNAVLAFKRQWISSDYRHIKNIAERAIKIMDHHGISRKAVLASSLVPRGQLDRAIAASKQGRDIGVAGRPSRLNSTQTQEFVKFLKDKTEKGISVNHQAATKAVCEFILCLIEMFECCFRLMRF